MLHKVLRERRYFLTALMFYTRFPIGNISGYDKQDLNHAGKYLPLVGSLVGGMIAVIYGLCQWIFPNSLAVLLSMLFGIMATGAFHEDGLADAADAFGGGWTKASILNIMKDSRLGTYGTLALILALGLKWSILEAMPVSVCILGLILGHTQSRLIPLMTIYRGHYVREEDGKAKPLAKKMLLSDLVIATLWTLGICVLMAWQSLLLLPTLLSVGFLMEMYFKKWIQGYTGDCLGAMQQISELVFYLNWYLLWKYACLDTLLHW